MTPTRARDRVAATPGLRDLADQMFSRASGARLREGNAIRLLKNAAENYPAWLEAIRTATRSIHVEMYIVHEDDQGRMFADALIAQAKAGVRVRLVYDWVGGFNNTSRGFWNRLREGGVDVRCYNPPHFDSPIGWLSRDHRKVIVVDRAVAFVTGLCIGQAWAGDPARHRDPWRDTGVEVCGPAIADVEDAFADTWAATGEPLPPEDTAPVKTPLPPNAAANSGVALRVVATVPNTAGLFRVDQLVAGLARRTLWLTDAYYAGTTPYVQALRAAAEDGVDVRLLVPGSSDVPIVSPLSRAGYRPLLEAGVRVFEWNGSMLHAKTAVADGRWARVGSTNLNVTSWLGNRELDVIVEDEPFAKQMEAMFADDLGNATEIVLDARNRVRAPPPAAGHAPLMSSRGSSGGRAVAGAFRIGSTVSAAVTDRRVLEPIEAHIALIAGTALIALVVFALWFPRGLAYPIAVLAAWPAVALLVRGFALLRDRRRDRDRPK
ncbi:MAG TPA: phospholipase D-like domain-containing protein [Vicinamibacterales bacterium]|nr:phospholipase D-like domain-containing protein [Vicinamibacterales bacterium]